MRNRAGEFRPRPGRVRPGDLSARQQKLLPVESQDASHVCHLRSQLLRNPVTPGRKGRHRMFRRRGLHGVALACGAIGIVF